jgi:hypothetical protein
MSAQLDQAAFRRLARTILNNPSASARKAALLDIRKLEHPQVTALLEKVSQQDKDAEVRDLAQNLLTKRRIEAMLDDEIPSVDDLLASDEPEPEADFEAMTYQETDGWECRFCGTHNHRQATTCASCGAEAAATRPEKLRRLQPLPNADEVFLLHLSNAKILRGQKRGFSSANLGGGCLLLFMLPFMAVGLFVIAMAINEWREYQLIASTGVATRGQYVSRRYDDDDDGTTYYASYEFQVDGITYSSEQSIGRAVYDRVERGAGVEVHYAPSDPGVSRIAGTNDLGGPIFLTVFSIFWNLITWGVVIGTIYSASRNRQLIQGGQLVTGELLGVWGDKDSDGDLQVKAAYRFVAPDSGEALTKKESAQRNDLKGDPLPAVGTPVAVLYRNKNHFRML